jgi:hypothetical protein
MSTKALELNYTRDSNKISATRFSYILHLSAVKFDAAETLQPNITSAACTFCHTGIIQLLELLNDILPFSA